MTDAEYAATGGDIRALDAEAWRMVVGTPVHYDEPPAYAVVRHG